MKDGLFEIGDEVRLTMTTKANNGVQVPWGAMGHIISVPNEGMSGHIDVEFSDFAGLPALEEGEEREPIIAFCQIAFLELIDPPVANEGEQEPFSDNPYLTEEAREKMRADHKDGEAKHEGDAR